MKFYSNYIAENCLFWSTYIFVLKCCIPVILFFPLLFFCFCSSVCSSRNSLSKTVGELQETFLLYLFEVSLGCLDVWVFFSFNYCNWKKKDQYSVAKYFYSVEFGNVWLTLLGLEKHHILARRQVLGCCVQYSFKTIELESRINLVLEKLISLEKK